MAYNHPLKKDIIKLCKGRGLQIGKFTKTQLIVHLEENDHSMELVLVLAESSQTAPGSAPEGPKAKPLR